MDFRVAIRRNAMIIALAGFFGVSCPNTVWPQPCIPPQKLRDAGPSALAPSFLNAWVARYPTSTLPARMDAQTGRDCNVCHHPPSFNTPGNCYRDALTELLMQGVPIDVAINQLDPLDSDGDGVSNGAEALAARPEAGEVGYNPGLVGDLGTDPCGNNPSTPVSGVAETPPLPPVPTVSTWGIAALVLLLWIGASVVLRSRVTCSPIAKY